MKINKNFNRKNDNATVTVNYETIEECPISRKAVRTLSDGSKQYSEKNYKMVKLNHSSPVNFKEREFDAKLKKVSPQFVKVYNQALKAEEFSLDEIAGLGYRKALEFLIKDFAIYNNPEKAEWIGNDQAHYAKIQDDRDVNNMKNFIDALVYFISMSLIVDDAQTMKSKKEDTKNV